MAFETFKSTVTWSGQGVFVEGKARDFAVSMDEPKSLGGTNKAMNPVEMLLVSLGGCITICGAAFAKACKVELNGLSVELEGDLDTDGFLGINPETRRGFQQIRYTLHIDSPSAQENIDALIALIEDRCPVSDTLKGVEIKAVAK
jgi:uncharacterized OsmC-like protein